MTDRDYHAWRGAAAGALRHALTENQRLKTSIRQLREEARAKAAGVDLSDPDVLIAAAAKLLRRLASEGVDFDASEQALVDALSDWKVR